MANNRQRLSAPAVFVGNCPVSFRNHFLSWCPSPLPLFRYLFVLWVNGVLVTIVVPIPNQPWFVDATDPAAPPPPTGADAATESLLRVLEGVVRSANHFLNRRPANGVASCRVGVGNGKRGLEPERRLKPFEWPYHMYALNWSCTAVFGRPGGVDQLSRIYLHPFLCDTAPKAENRAHYVTYLVPCRISDHGRPLPPVVMDATLLATMHN
ncbi:hypothetical protein LZ32DRAFT_454153 [Colletotrichum eremochloae]|nr:hypothetical protein LZ32DRAFT_454153 [Colletotrichum eremochloae]